MYSIFFYSFASGLPFLLILSTLSIWLTELGISKTMIGLLAWVSIPYSLKFLCGRMVDHLKIPLLYPLLGLRRSWIFLSQLCLFLMVIALANTDPSKNLGLTALCAFLVGCCSAIQDLAIEAYRIEKLPAVKAGMGASVSVLGYRLGMLCSGAGTIYLAAIFNSWSMAYHCIAFFILVGIFATILSKEPKVHREIVHADKLKIDWKFAIPFILSYKVADTILNSMSMPFLLEIGFDKLDIANVAKSFGIGAMIIGGFVGGVLLSKRSLHFNLFTCILLQCVASSLFILQAYVGANVEFLFVTMGVENFSCGMSQVALIAYFSQLCSHNNTAFHYAILSSFASFVRVSFSALAGWMADIFAWPQFYALVCISCVPSLLLLALYSRGTLRWQLNQTVG